jgi:xylulokinase
MIIEALDTAFARLQASGVEIKHIKAVKIDAMQHCTVYADLSLVERLSNLDPRHNLLPQLLPCITRRSSPIWEDRSTTEEVNYLTNILAQNGSIQFLTGNKAELRFPAAQILKWARQSPAEYAQTEHIFLLSAFLSSILAGNIAPVDTGDGWGTNLNNLDINNPGWSDIVIRAVDRYLCKMGLEASIQSRLGGITNFDAFLGLISPYFTKKYGICSEALVLAGTGDNPATLLGCGGQTVVSLGSSYTVNGVMEDIAPSSTGEYNVYGYILGNTMALTVFTNGAKVHEYFMEKYAQEMRITEESEKDWEVYVSAAGETILNDNEKLMLPYLLDESVPVRSRGIIREGFTEQDGNTNIRALHISQALALKLHSPHSSHANEICVVGGAARNRFLRQLIADVFDARTYTIKYAGFAACLGCAISGAKALLQIPYEEAASRYVQVDKTSQVGSIRENRAAIRTLLRRYGELESGTT